MKYSSSIRLINICVFVLLLAGFGFLGVWYGFIINPNMIMGSEPIPGSSIKLPEVSIGLTSMLGIFGLAAGIVSLLGLIFSIQSFLRGSKDEPVVKSFCCYISIGYIISIFFLLNAMWLYRLTSSNIGDDDIGFVIAVYAILFIISIIGSNVPLMHMFGEGEHTNKIMKLLSGTIFSADFAVALVFAVLYFFNLGKSFSYSNYTLMKILCLTLMPLLGALLSGIAYLGYSNAEKHNKIIKGNGYLFETSLLANGGAIIGAGLFSQLQYDNVSENISFIAKTYSAKHTYMLEFASMSYVTGGILVFISLLLIYYTVFPPKIKVERA